MVTVPSVSCQLWCPKVSKGERREAGIQWIQPPKAVSDPEFRQTTSGAHGSANRADCLPRGKPFSAPAGARLFPCRGTDAPTPAREQSLQPYGAFTLFFRWRKKSVRKPAARRLREKGFYCPFWRRGRNVARNEVGQLPPALGARSCSPFSAVKMGGPFSLRCLSPLCFAAGDAGQTQTAMLGMLRCDRDDSTARKNRLDFYSVVGINRTQIMSVWIFRHVLEFPET